MLIGNFSKTQTNTFSNQNAHLTSQNNIAKLNLRKIVTAAVVFGLAGLQGSKAQDGFAMREPAGTNLRHTNSGDFTLDSINTSPEISSAERKLQALPPLTLDIVKQTQVSLGSVAEETGFNGAYGALKLAQLLTAYDSSVDLSDIISRPLTEVLANPKLKTLLTDLVGASAVAVLSDANIGKVSKAGSDLTKGILTDPAVRTAISGTVGDAATAVLTDTNIGKISNATSSITKGILTDPAVRTAISGTVGDAATAVLTDANIAKVSKAGSDLTKGILTDPAVRTAISGTVGDAATAVLTDANIAKISTATKDLLTNPEVQDALKSLVSSALDGLVASKPTAACPPFGC